MAYEPCVCGEPRDAHDEKGCMWPGCPCKSFEPEHVELGGEG